MNKRISVVIPNYNGITTIGKCLDSVFSSGYDNFEVIVVDDCSTDNSIEIIKKFPCKIIRSDKNSGASSSRNTGACNSSGDILFFTDADCILQKGTLSSVDKAFSGDDSKIIGGTYTKVPYDDRFFSAFQSIFINYSETKKKAPDYVATHAMVIDRNVFQKSGGFAEDFLPILEDVEFSHRLRRSGYKLAMNPDILVQHIFNFTFKKSLLNALRKTTYWTVYSLKNKDWLKDSGTASLELKANVASLVLNTFLIILFFFYKNTVFLMLILLIFTLNLVLNSGLLMSFYTSKGFLFSLKATLYYMFVYPFAVGTGAIIGILKFIWIYKIQKRLI
jgi:glycosyltransferase involved in cell wall biosynthesis